MQLLARVLNLFRLVPKSANEMKAADEAARLEAEQERLRRSPAWPGVVDLSGRGRGL